MRITANEFVLASVAIVIGPLCAAGVLQGRRGPSAAPAWWNAQANIARLEMELGTDPAKLGFSVEDLERWLRSDLPSSHALSKFDVFATKVDPWGNTFVCIERPVPRAQTENDANCELRFYSLGRDGVSRSNGNDPDDINCWDPLSTQHYEEERHRWSNALPVIGIALSVPLVFIVLVCIQKAFQTTTGISAQP